MKFIIFLHIVSLNSYLFASISTPQRPTQPPQKKIRAYSVQRNLFQINLFDLPSDILSIALSYLNKESQDEASLCCSELHIEIRKTYNDQEKAPPSRTAVWINHLEHPRYFHFEDIPKTLRITKCCASILEGDKISLEKKGECDYSAITANTNPVREYQIKGYNLDNIILTYLTSHNEIILLSKSGLLLVAKTTPVLKISTVNLQQKRLGLNAYAISPEENFLAYCARGQALEVFAIPSLEKKEFEVPNVSQEPEKSISSIAIHKNNKWLALSYFSGLIQIWDIPLKEIVYQRKYESRSFTSNSFSACGNFLVTSCSKGKIEILNCKSQENRSFHISCDQITKILFSSCRKYIYATSSRDFLRLDFDIEKNKVIEEE
jgi:WD40 repeat protein